MNFRFTVAQRVTLAAIALFLVGVIPLAIFNLDRIENKMTQVLTEQQMAATNFVANDLEQKILLRVASLQDVAAHIPADAMGDAALVQAYLSRRLAIYRLFSNGVFVIGRDGKYIADWPRLPGRQRNDWNGIEYFDRAVSTRETVIANPRIGRATGTPGMAVGVPIKNAQGDVVAVIAGVIGLADKTIFDHGVNQKPGTASYTLISLSNGLVVSDQNEANILKPVDRVFSPTVVSILMDGRDGAAVAQAAGNDPTIFVARRAILDGKLLVVNATPESSLLRPLVELRDQILVAYLVVTFLIAAMMWFVMNQLLRPVIHTTREIRKMVDGDIPIKVLPVTRSDEFGDLIVAFNKLFTQIESGKAALEGQAHTDYLTGLANRRYFMKLAENELARSKRFNNSLTVCMLDLDHFKRVNDTYGHKAGDIVLTRVASLLRRTLREVDIVGRFGGEEFACVLPETDCAGALEVMERLRALISQSPVDIGDGTSVSVTISIGIARRDGADGQTIEELLQLADQALYEAKKVRNRVSVANGGSKQSSSIIPAIRYHYP